jgi:hypothetical protein
MRWIQSEGNCKLDVAVDALRNPVNAHAWRFEHQLAAIRALLRCGMVMKTTHGQEDAVLHSSMLC